MSRRDLLCGRCGDPAPFGFAMAFDDGVDRRAWACPLHRDAALLASRASWERPLPAPGRDGGAPP